MAYGSQPGFSIYAPQQSSSSPRTARSNNNNSGGYSTGNLMDQPGYSNTDWAQDMRYRGPHHNGFFKNDYIRPQQAATGGQAPQSYTPEQAATQFQSQYGRAPSQQDVQRFMAASGWSGQGAISQQQYDQGMAAMRGFMQQEGNLGAVQMPEPGPAPSGPGSFQSSIAAGQQLAPGYTMPQAAQNLQTQAGQVASAQMGAPANQYGAFTAAAPVAMPQRNALLEQMAANPDVFGAQQQAQLFEQQKEQLLNQQRQAQGRLSQLMTSRGLSGRGGTELMGQAGLEGDLMSGLLAGQRDIALQSAQANQQNRQNVLNAILGTQQADTGMAAENYRTGLSGFQANEAAQGRRDDQAMQAAQFANLIGQQGFQNYLAQAGLGIQGTAIAEQAEMARANMDLQQYLDLLNYNLRARGQEQDYAMRVLDQNRLREQGMFG